MSTRLTHLTLANNTVAGLTQILNAVAETCEELQVLDLSNIRTAAITSALIPLERLQEGCAKLRVFRIANSNGGQPLVSDSAIERILKTSHQLRLLDVRGCIRISDSSLAASPGFPQLEELSLAVDKQGGQPLVSDSAIERILKTSHQLRLLDVRGCIRISDSSLVRVPAWDLEHLFLSGSYRMVLSLLGSSVGFGPVKEALLRCPQLYSLNLSSCRGLPRGIKRLYVGDDLTELRRNVAAGKFDENSEDQSASPSQSSPPAENQ
ncbi:hypothetical protein B566_EDAN012492 [Ephemera danica]|nr:hypothetical protein B566_EDAN012492 [Ephemera danica]